MAGRRGQRGGSRRPRRRDVQVNAGNGLASAQPRDPACHNLGMPDQPARRSAPPRDPPAPGDQRPPGWRVTPAPDGRGVRDGAPPPGRPRSRWWIGLVIVGLLALNLWISSQALQPNAPVRIPYSPTFLTQVKAGNVKEISSKGDAIQGTLKKALRYPANDQNVQPTTNIATQVPSFANNQELSSLLQSENVIIDAQPATSG